MDPIKKLHADLARRHKRPPVSLQEKLVAVTAALAMAAPPWIFGSMTWWAQSILLALCAISFLVALWPVSNYKLQITNSKSTAKSPRSHERGYASSPQHPTVRPSDRPTVPQSHRTPISALLRFPLFSIGLIFLLYISIQALNTNWEYATSADGGSWWLQKKPEGSYIAWLPTGMDTPFTQMNAWRALMYWAAPWLLLCALWVGITRRRTAGFLLWVLALNAFTVGLLVIAQKLSGAEGMYWTYPSQNPEFAGPFTYRNHAGAFLYLSLAAPAILLYLTLRRREQGWLGKMVFLSFLLLFIYIAAVFTGSRGAFLFGTLYLVALLAIILFTQLFQGWKGLAVAFILPVVLATMAYAFWPQVSGVVQVLEDNLSRTEKQMEGIEEGTDIRIRTPQVVWEMVEDKPWTGWGGGSFRYYFPVYQYQYPELTYSNYYREMLRRERGRRPRAFIPIIYHYAHTDTLQMASEYGLPIVGLLLLGGTLLLLWKVGGATGFVCLVLTGSGILLYYSHSWIEFLLFSPPGLLVAISLLAIRPKL